MAAMHLTLRPATADDDAFLRDLFAAVRGPMFAGLPADVAAPLLLQQFRAQHHGHRTAYPDAEDVIVEVGDRPVGRWLVDRGADAITLVDVAIHPDHQARGIGSELLRGLTGEADRIAARIRLSVADDNPARGLYERFGFLQVATEGAYDSMQREPVAGHRDAAPGGLGKDGT